MDVTNAKKSYDENGIGAIDPSQNLMDFPRRSDEYNCRNHQDGNQSSKDPTYELLDQLLSPASVKEIHLGIYEGPVDIKKEGKLVKFCMSMLGGNIVVYITNPTTQQAHLVGRNSTNIASPSTPLPQEKNLYQVSYRKKLNHTEIFLANCTYEIFSTFQEAIKYINSEHPSINTSDEAACVAQLVGDRNTNRILASLLACTSYRTALSKNLLTCSKLAQGLGDVGLACRVMFLLERIYFGRILYAETQGDIDADLWQDLCVWIDMGELLNNCDAIEQLKEGHKNYNPEVFWPLMYGCLLTGKLSMARSILYCHPNYFYVQNSTHGGSSPTPPSPYSFLSIIIKYTPLPSSGGKDSTESTAKWREFLEEHVYQELISGIESLEERIYFLKAVEILRGSESVIKETASSWREALLGLYLYTYRGTRAFNLHTIVDKVRCHAQNTILDAIEMAILSQDLRMAISLCSKAGWWFAPHVMDIIYNSAMFKQSFSFSKKIASKLSIDDAITQMRDWYIFHYSELLLVSPSLWHVALEYLSHCTSNGISFCSSVARALFVDSHVSLRRITALCRKFNLDDDARMITEVYRYRHNTLPIHRLLTRLQEPPTVKNLIACQGLLKDIIPQSTDDHTMWSILNSIIPMCTNIIMEHRITMLCLQAMILQQTNKNNYDGAIKNVFRLLDIRSIPIWSSYIIKTDITDLMSKAPHFFTNSNILEILRHANTLSDISVDTAPSEYEAIRMLE